MSDEYMSLIDFDAVDDGETVGILHEWERGPETVAFADAGRTVRQALTDGIGDESSRLFISSVGGDFKLDYGPMFDAPITTNLTKAQARLAFETLSEPTPARSCEILFDDHGPIVFRTDEKAVATTPVRFPWHERITAQRTRTPCGPSLGGSQ